LQNTLLIEVISYVDTLHHFFNIIVGVGIDMFVSLSPTNIMLHQIKFMRPFHFCIYRNFHIKFDKK